MPQSVHDRAADRHNLAAHGHAGAATAHGRGNFPILTAHELTKQARDYSIHAHELAEELVGSRTMRPRND